MCRGGGGLGAVSVCVEGWWWGGGEAKPDRAGDMRSGQVMVGKFGEASSGQARQLTCLFSD